MFNKIEDDFICTGRAITRDEMVFFSKENAILFMQEIVKTGHQILGIDAFIITEDKIQPDMSRSVDFSNLKTNGLFEGLQFLNKIDHKNIYFEITFDRNQL